MVSAVKDFDQQQSAVSYGDPGCHAGQYLVADAILIFTGDLSAGQGEFMDILLDELKQLNERM